jgi:hypothetical protein
MIALRHIFFLVCLLISSDTWCQITVNNINDSLLYQILKGKDPLIDEVLNNPSRYEFQLIYTKINRQDSKLILEERSLNKDKFYFNPASLIKFPLAVVGLEYLYSLRKYGAGLNSKILLNTCSCDFGTNQYVSKSANPTPEQFVREMMIMSNNDAYNLFFDLVGIDRCNTRMKEMGLNGIIMRRRISAGCSDENNRINGGIQLLNDNDSVIYKVPCDSSITNLMPDSSLPTKAGRSHFEKGKKINKPFDYSKSNHVRLADANDLMIRLFFTELIKDSGALFKFDDVYRNFFIESLGGFPRELLNAAQDYSKTPDHYYKFFMDPSVMNTSTGNFRIYNKVGLAGGFVSDVSYFEDKENNISFFLSGAVFAKKDGIINGGKNNYNDLGIPLFRKIGSLIYRYEQEEKNKAGRL